MARLNGKVAAVIGGASGIGEATVRRFVMEGAKEAAAFVRQAAQRFGRLNILVNNAGVRLSHGGRG